MNRNFAIGLVLAAALGACGAAAPIRLADPTVARRRAANDFDLGVAAFRRGEYAVALEYFRRADAMEPSPDVTFDIARTHDAMGHDAQAARAYVSYLQAIESTGSEYARDALDALERLRPRVGWILIRPTATVVVDGVRVDASGVPVPIAVLPGVRFITRQPDREIAVRIRAGEVLSVDFAAPDASLVFASATNEDLRAVTVPRLP